MSVLSDVDIIDAIISGRIICRPLRPENIRGASIDLTLGKHFWRCDANPNGVFNPYDEDEIKRYFAGPFEAKPYASVYEKLADTGMHCSFWPRPGGVTYWAPAVYEEIDGEIKLIEKAQWKISESPFENIPDDWPVIVMRPGERILGCSHEFVGIDRTGTSQLHARSSTGRVGMKVCDDAGLGDPGWIGRWTKEMRNDNKEAIILPVGERLAQINFFDLATPARESYGSEKLYASKYQDGNDINKIIENWTPEDMLPRNYKDKRVPLGSLDGDLYELVVSQLSLARIKAEDEHVSKMDQRARMMLP